MAHLTQFCDAGVVNTLQPQLQGGGFLVKSGLFTTAQNPLRRTASVKSKLNDPVEQRRLAALRVYQILDTPPEQSFDRITALATALFHVPISTISLIDENRQWFKSRIDMDATETLRDVSF